MSGAKVHIEFFDTTLRDGAQSVPAHHQFEAGDKTAIAELLATLGVDVIEAGIPRTPGDAEEVAEVASSVGQGEFPVRMWRNSTEIGVKEFSPVIVGLCRTTPEDIETTWASVHKADYPRIHTFISTDAEHIHAKFPGKTLTDVLTMGRDAIRLAKDYANTHPGSSIEFSAEAASTTEPKYLERIVKMAVDEGVDVINLPDTVGQRHPFQMLALYEQAIRWAQKINKDVRISAHNHNDLGMATANSFALVFAAAKIAEKTSNLVNIQIESSICGLGERAGNADIFPVVGNIVTHAPELPVDVEWQFNPHFAVLLGNAVLEAVGLEVHRQNPIIGRDINVHRSGIHSDGVLKGGYGIYTPFNPRFWGHAEEARHEDGKYQGKRGRAAISGSVG